MENWEQRALRAEKALRKIRSELEKLKERMDEEVNNEELAAQDRAAARVALFEKQDISECDRLNSIAGILERDLQVVDHFRSCYFHPRVDQILGMIEETQGGENNGEA